MKYLLFFLVSIFSLSALSQSVQDFSFVQNKGQWNSKVLYRTQVDGGTVYLESDGITYDFVDQQGMQTYFHGHHQQTKKKLGRLKAHAYKVQFVGGSAKKIEATDPQEGYYNYYLGQDKSKWASRVRRFSKTRSKEIYPGVDLIFYSQNGYLKYDFEVAANANPSIIELNYSGVEDIKIKKINSYLPPVLIPLPSKNLMLTR
jgi:hypothetical protein